MNLLVNPRTAVQDGFTPPPLALLYLAANDPDTIVFDSATKGDAVPFIQEHKPKIVGCSMHTGYRMEAIRVLKEAKALGCKTVAGGVHVSIMHKQLEEHYPFIDHLVVGDGELAWKAICEGQNLSRVIRMPVLDLDSLPQPKWDAIDLRSYPGRGIGIINGINLSTEPRTILVYGRGCSGRCHFCSTWWVNGLKGKYRHHGMKWMEQTLIRLRDIGCRNLIFMDDNLTDDRNAALELCELLTKFNFIWGGIIRADHLDLELAVKMKAAGCYELCFGIETGSEELLEKINKQTNLQKALEARMICARVGIRFMALMMYGLPYETPELRKQTNNFIGMLRPDSIGSEGHTIIFPGTVFYQRCKAAGIIDDDFWLGDEKYFIYKGGL